MLNMAEKEIPVPAESARVTSIACLEFARNIRKSGLPHVSKRIREHVPNVIRRISDNKDGEYVTLRESEVEVLMLDSIFDMDGFDEDYANTVRKHNKAIEKHYENQINK